MSVLVESEALSGSYVLQYIGRGEGPIWLDEVDCSGNEKKLSECQNRTHDCSHVEDAGIRCRHQGTYFKNSFFFSFLGGRGGGGGGGGK